MIRASGVVPRKLTSTITNPANAASDAPAAKT